MANRRTTIRQFLAPTANARFTKTRRCPYCENYISAEDSRPVPKTRFIILGTLAALAAIVWWIMH